MTAKQQKEAAEQKRRTLFQIADSFSEMAQQIELAEGELSAVMEASLDKLGWELDDKAQSYAIVCTELQARADASKAVAKRYQDRAQAAERRVQELKDRLYAVLKAVGRDHAGGAVAVASIQKNGQPKVTLAVDEREVIEAFRESAVSMRKLREAALDDSHSWHKEARELVTIEYGEHLRFR